MRGKWYSEDKRGELQVLNQLYTTNLRLRRERRLQQQGVITSTNTPLAMMWSYEQIFSESLLILCGGRRSLQLIFGTVMRRGSLLDEITPGLAIVCVGGRSTAKMMTEGSREFYSVLESVSATGGILTPFIIWQGKTHRESYYPEGDRSMRLHSQSPRVATWMMSWGWNMCRNILSPIPGVINPPLAASLWMGIPLMLPGKLLNMPWTMISI